MPNMTPKQKRAVVERKLKKDIKALRLTITSLVSAGVLLLIILNWSI